MSRPIGMSRSLLPSHLCRRHLQTGELVRVLPEWSTSCETVHLVYTTRKGLRPSVRVLVDYLVAEVEPLIGGGEPVTAPLQAIGAGR